MKTGLSILEVLQPPPGFVTEATLGTSYSVDLVACMVALTAHDLVADDAGEYKRLQALRALERLRDRARIAVQQGRISWQGKSRRALTLLDRIVKPVAFDGNYRSFHPKTWIVKQADAEGRSRWVLLVGSRNLTTSRSWDLGIALEGSPDQHKGRLLPELPGFVDLVSELIGEPQFASRFAGLDKVRWSLPEGFDDVRFWFQPGAPGETPIDKAEPFRLGRSERVLVISPFLDNAMVTQSAQAWSTRELRLVAGGADLRKVSRTSARAALMSLHPHQLDLIDEQADAIVSEAEANERERLDRGLHAKAIALFRGDRSTLLVGSANLTRRAWCGLNCEAALILSGTAEATQPLWDWSQQAVEFIPPDEPEPEEDAAEKLDRLRNSLAAECFQLTDHPANGAKLIAGAPVDLQLSSAGVAALAVARLSTPAERIEWPHSATEVLFPPCGVAERTAFLVFELKSGDVSVSWVQAVKLTPELDDARDRAAVLELLGFDGFLRYLQALIQGDGFDATDDDDDDSTGSRAGAHPAPEGGGFRLEDLVRLIVSDGDKSDRFAELRKTLERYRTAVARMPGSAEQAHRLDELWRTWDAIEEGMRIP